MDYVISFVEWNECITILILFAGAFKTFLKIFKISPSDFTEWILTVRFNSIPSFNYSVKSSFCFNFGFLVRAKSKPWKFYDKWKFDNIPISPI